MPFMDRALGVAQATQSLELNYLSNQLAMVGGKDSMTESGSGTSTTALQNRSCRDIRGYIP